MGVYVGFAGVAGAVLVGLVVGMTGLGGTPASQPRPRPSASSPTSTASAPNDATVALAREAAAPSVVSLGASPATGPTAAAGRAGSRDEPHDGETPGTGVIVRPDGIVVTSTALVGPAPGPMEVGLQDGRRVLGQVVGTDPVTGLAVLDLPGAGYPTAKPAGSVPGRGTTVVTVAVAEAEARGASGTGTGTAAAPAPAPAPASRRGRPPRAVSAPPGGSPARGRWRSRAW